MAKLRRLHRNYISRILALFNTQNIAQKIKLKSACFYHIIYKIKGCHSYNRNAFCHIVALCVGQSADSPQCILRMCYYHSSRTENDRNYGNFLRKTYPYGDLCECIKNTKCFLPSICANFINLVKKGSKMVKCCISTCPNYKLLSPTVQVEKFCIEDLNTIYKICKLSDTTLSSGLPK